MNMNISISQRHDEAVLLRLNDTSTETTWSLKKKKPNWLLCISTLHSHWVFLCESQAFSRAPRHLMPNLRWKAVQRGVSEDFNPAGRCRKGRVTENMLLSPGTWGPEEAGGLLWRWNNDMTGSELCDEGSVQRRRKKGGEKNGTGALSGKSISHNNNLQ